MRRNPIGYQFATLMVTRKAIVMIRWERFYRDRQPTQQFAVEPLPQLRAYLFTAFGKNNCSPPIL